MDLVQIRQRRAGIRDGVGFWNPDNALVDWVDGPCQRWPMSSASALNWVGVLTPEGEFLPCAPYQHEELCHLLGYGNRGEALVAGCCLLQFLSRFYVTAPYGVGVTEQQARFLNLIPDWILGIQDGNWQP